MDRFGRENNYWLGKKLSPKHCEKIRLARIGKKFSEESRLKMRLSHLGHKDSDITKLKKSLIHKGNKYCLGRAPWNKGLKGIHLNPSGEFKKGHIPWIKGKENIWSKTPEYKQKMRGATSGEKNGFYGKTHTPEVRKIISESRMGHIPWNKGKPFPQVAGEKNVNWNGGTMFEPYPLGWTRIFKEQIRQRDRYKCQICNVPEAECLRPLNIHHIDYQKNNLLPDNLISLCAKCHGKTNKKREYWIGYFKSEKCNV